jgi:hypothetical protein
LLSTITTSGGDQRSAYVARSTSALIPIICIAPSPRHAMTGRSGYASLAASA